MKYISILIVIAIAACTSSSKQEKTTQKDIKEVEQILQNQLDAWNQGDHLGFMQGYWKSDSMRFCGRNGTSYGWQKTLEMYQKSFPNRDDMGKLIFEIDTIIGDKPPYITVDGKWEIQRSDTIGGCFVLLFAQKNNEWKIIEDHTW